MQDLRICCDTLQIYGGLRNRTALPGCNHLKAREKSRNRRHVIVRSIRVVSVLVKHGYGTPKQHIVLLCFAYEAHINHNMKKSNFRITAMNIETVEKQEIG